MRADQNVNWLPVGKLFQDELNRDPRARDYRLSHHNVGVGDDRSRTHMAIVLREGV